MDELDPSNHIYIKKSLLLQNNLHAAAWVHAVIKIDINFNLYRVVGPIHFRSFIQ
jgi:hypothetical protein